MALHSFAAVVVCGGGGGVGGGGVLEARYNRYVLNCFHLLLQYFTSCFCSAIQEEISI